MAVYQSLNQKSSDYNLDVMPWDLLDRIMLKGPLNSYLMNNIMHDYKPQRTQEIQQTNF